MHETEAGAGAALATARRHPGLAGKYLTFTLAGEQFGLQILKVREIIGLLDVTPLPQAPPEVRGVINLRGKVIPVVDLRRRFGMPGGEATERSCIVVVDTTLRGRFANVGVLVDGVSEVLDIRDEDIEPPPAFGHGLEAEFLLGLAKAGGKVKILLDIDQALRGHHDRDA